MISSNSSRSFRVVCRSLPWGSRRTAPGKMGGFGVLRGLAMAGLALGAVASLEGCVNVSAPDKPIVIELNINIRQEVIYRLAADAANTIEENPEIF